MQHLTQSLVLSSAMESSLETSSSSSRLKEATLNALRSSSPAMDGASSLVSALLRISSISHCSEKKRLSIVFILSTRNVNVKVFFKSRRSSKNISSLKKKEANCLILLPIYCFALGQESVLTIGSSSFSSSSLKSSSAPNFRMAFNSSRLNGLEFEPRRQVFGY